MYAILEKIFKLKQNNTSISVELMAGLTTFATMSYILAVNPAILSATGMDKASLVTVTALASVLGCLFMAFFANLPIALAPAMGTNAYFAIIVCLGMGIKWEQALALVFYNGIFFLLISITGLREKFILGVPKALQIGLQAGIGIFIAFFGLQSSKIIISDTNTLVTAGNLTSPECMLTLFGIAITAVMMVKKFKPAIILSIVILTCISYFTAASNGEKLAKIPDAIFSLPHGISDTFFKLDFAYPFREFNKALPIILILLILDMFDTLATIIALGRRTGLMNEDGRMKKIGRAFAADACATISGALLGTSTTGAYVESASGIEAGGRTGLVPTTVAILFLLALFFSPIIASVPPIATAPALVMVGILMTQGLRELNFNDLSELVPAISCMLITALSFKITEGFAMGIISFVLMRIATNRIKEINPATWFVFTIMCLFIAFMH